MKNRRKAALVSGAFVLAGALVLGSAAALAVKPAAAGAKAQNVKVEKAQGGVSANAPAVGKTNAPVQANGQHGQSWPKWRGSVSPANADGGEVSVKVSVQHVDLPNKSMLDLDATGTIQAQWTCTSDKGRGTTVHRKQDFSLDALDGSYRVRGVNVRTGAVSIGTLDMSCPADNQPEWANGVDFTADPASLAWAWDVTVAAVVESGVGGMFEAAEGTIQLDS